MIVATNPAKNVPALDFPQRKTVKPKLLGTILERAEKIDSKYILSDLLWSSHQARKERHKINGNGFGFGIVDENSPHTRTISARYYKDGSEILISRGKKNPRKLTPREAVRLQGFPEKFRVVVSDNQAYKQMGNSVAVPVFRFVAEQVVKLIVSEVVRKKWSPVPLKSVKAIIAQMPDKQAKFFSVEQ